MSPSIRIRIGEIVYGDDDPSAAFANVSFPSVPPSIPFSQNSFPLSDRSRAQKGNLVVAAPNSMHSFSLGRRKKEKKKEKRRISRCYRASLCTEPRGWRFVRTYVPKNAVDDLNGRRSIKFEILFGSHRSACVDGERKKKGRKKERKKKKGTGRSRSG